MAVVMRAAAVVAMVVHAVALPERYDAVCTYDFTLVVTCAASGEHSVLLLSARLWETLRGGVLGLVASSFFFPLRALPGLATRLIDRKNTMSYFILVTILMFLAPAACVAFPVIAHHARWTGRLRCAGSPSGWSVRDSAAPACARC